MFTVSVNTITEDTGGDEFMVACYVFSLIALLLNYAEMLYVPVVKLYKEKF